MPTYQQMRYTCPMSMWKITQGALSPCCNYLHLNTILIHKVYKVYTRCPWSYSLFRKWSNHGRFVVTHCGQKVKRTIVWKEMCIPRYVSVVQILVWVSFCTAVLPQLQLRWHRHWLVSIQSMGDLHSQVSFVLHFISHGRVVSIVETH